MYMFIYFYLGLHCLIRVRVSVCECVLLGGSGCVCVCVSDRAAGVCVTVLDVFRQARAGFYLHSLIRLLLLVPVVIVPVFGH